MNLEITDSTGTFAIPLQAPFVLTPLENSTDVTTLDFNVYTDFTGSQKRQWVQSYPYLTKAEYDSLVGYYNRQFTLFKYPTISVSSEGVVNVPVRMTVTQRDVIDNCGTVSGFTITLRETAQLP